MYPYWCRNKKYHHHSIEELLINYWKLYNMDNSIDIFFKKIDAGRSFSQTENNTYYHVAHTSVTLHCAVIQNISRKEKVNVS